MSGSGMSGFGAPNPPVDGLRFAVLPPDLSLGLLMGMSMAERRAALDASPRMHHVWRSRVVFDLPSSELYF